MKLKSLIQSLSLFIALIFFSCNNEAINESETLNDSFKTTDLKAQIGVVFIVEPTGVDDTQNIKDAFSDAKLAGDGNTVQLSAGTFIISEPIVVTDFNGTFKGAGKALTTLEDADGTFPLISSGPMEGQQGFIVFYLENNDVGNLAVSDLTIHLKNKTEEFVWFDWEWHNNSNLGLRIHGKTNGLADFANSTMNVKVNSIDFIGELGGDFSSGTSLDMALFISGEYAFEFTGTTHLLKLIEEMSGNIEVTNCLFKNNRLAVNISGTSDANITVGGSPNNKNNFDNVEGAMSFWDVSGAHLELSYNNGTNITGWGIWAEQGYSAYIPADGFGPYLAEFGIPDPAYVLIEHNDFSFGNWGIIISDITNGFGDGKSLYEVVSKNKFTMTNSWSAGIFGWDADEVLVSNNRFYGEGDAGVLFGLWGGPGHDNWVMQGNNFDNFNANIASIWLGPDSNNCTVVGGDNTVNVFDQGTNNILTGVNNQGNPPGPEIMAALLAKRDLIKSMRN